MKAKIQIYEVEEYENKNLKALDKIFREKYEIIIETDEALTNKIRINPFIFNGLTKNPFKLKERLYPVDFAYKRANNYYINLKFPKGYKLVQSPKNFIIGLPNNGGRCIIKSNSSENGISVYVRFSINKKVFDNTEYLALKEFYNQIIQAEKSYIILEKSN